MREIQLNMYHALALGAVMYWLGAALTRKLPALRRFCVPAPLVGGLCFALLNTLLYASGLAVITFDETLETVFMILFFTTVGFTVSIPMLVKSGRSVMLLLALSIVIILLQNAVGSGVMALMGKNPLYGLGCGSISMIGGPGTAAAIGVGLGSYVTTGLTKLCGFNFPAYIGPMLVAVLVRNLIDHTGHIEFPAAEISTMGNMFLAIFLSMALSGLKLWQLVDLALPMLVCLAAEVLLMVFFSILVVFPLMGRNYDAAMITAGFIGFGMGATSNAMANMQAVARRYGPSPSAYFMIPMVGGLFNDFFNAAIIALSIGLLS